MDLDIEMGDSGEPVHDVPVDQLPGADDILQPDEPDEPGEIADDAPAPADDGHTIVPNKVNVRGVDTLHTDDIKSYVRAHYGPVDKVEWVDDSSANLVFGSESTARDAIAALSAIEIADATALPVGESLPAKPVEGKPEIALHVRFALAGDKKQRGAALRSRYYLLHPEHDPEERRRKQQESRSRYRERDGSHRRGGGRRRRDSDDEIETFKASMYDDEPRAARRDRSSDVDDRRRSFARENRGKELFAGRAQQRDRSASPLRDGDGDATMDSLTSSSRNRTSARSIRDRITGDNRSKELFPSKASGRGGQLDRLEDSIGSAQLRDEDRPKVVSVPSFSKAGSLNIKGLANQPGESTGEFNIKGSANARELFPTKLGGSNQGKELFDGNRSKQRQKAQDLFG